MKNLLLNLPTQNNVGIFDEQETKAVLKWMVARMEDIKGRLDG